ncbi:MAG: YabP/YqfC family sporulation protein [Eubacterium sp.]|nr:YabP/YqfC family sporulation protein [Eubacterium sp.]MDD7209134.1 YabP/YqfC family sporulation protein [Lachnospiraceae bacterium]MDY5497728.1 YabP/YqfC family sporulation protein [Anaerobutyricum sp.]
MLRNKEVVCTVNGTREIFIENYGSLGDFTDGKIILHCFRCDLVIEGKGLVIEYFTDMDMKITGCIQSIRF